MTFKEQFSRLKDNWLIIVLVVLALLMFSGAGNIASSFGSLSPLSEMSYSKGAAQDAMGRSSGYYPPNADNDFAPEEPERKLVTTANLGVEVGTGTFDQAASRLKAITTGTESLILSENVYTTKPARREYRTGNYQIKVEKTKYQAAVSQLREIGEVKSFSENTQDITGAYVDNKIELEVEKARLERYQEMYRKAVIVADQITLNDRIFDQERRIQYLQDSLTNQDRQVEYSTVYFTLTEKRTEYFDIAFVKLSQLVRTFIQSVNSLFFLIAGILPYAIAALIGWGIYRLVRGR